MPDSKPSAKREEPIHADTITYGAVYVNELASKSYNATPQQPFSEGSIIVREKLTYQGASKPQVLAVMIKREKGFNPAANDWLFLTVDGGLAKVKARTKKGSCLGCHQYALARDYVFELK